MVAQDFVEAIRQIEGAVTGVLADEAKEKIASASEKIQDYFNRIAEHPALRAIRIDVGSKKVTGQNDYKFYDDQRQEITPILSQGDYNALALAIFLGLGVASGDAGKLGFLMLDDPSQSLAPEHQRRLVKILDEVNGYRHEWHCRPCSSMVIAHCDRRTALAMQIFSVS